MIRNEVLLIAVLTAVPPRVAERSGDTRRQGNSVDAAGEPRRRQEAERQDREADHAGAPAIAVGEQLARRCSDHRAQRACGRDHAEHGTADGDRHGARRDGQCDRRSGAGERQADQHAGTDHHAPKALRGGQHHEARDVEDRAGQHQRPETEARRQGAGEGLQDAPGDVLDGDGHGEVGDGEREVAGQRLEEEAKTLAKTMLRLSRSAAPSRIGRAGRKAAKPIINVGPFITQICVLYSASLSVASIEIHRSV